MKKFLAVIILSGIIIIPQRALARSIDSGGRSSPSGTEYITAAVVSTAIIVLVGMLVGETIKSCFSQRAAANQQIKFAKGLHLSIQKTTVSYPIKIEF
ncbi:MAG: hypothetical protein ACE5GM_01085 [bacterium]